MSSYMISILIISGLIASAGQDDRLTVDNGDRHAQAGGRFLAGYSNEGNGRWVVEFYDNRSDGDPPQFTARRALDGAARQEQIEWVSSETCPEIGGVLEALNNLAAPPIRIPNLRRSSGPQAMAQQPQGPATDANFYTVWGRSVQAEGSFAVSRFSANTGPIADWARFADAQLAACWKPQASRP